MLEESVRQHLEVASALLKDRKTLDNVSLVAEKLVAAYRNGGKLIIFGNGGSAADAQHAAAELLGKFMRERKALPAIALTTNTSNITAIGNDMGYELTFKRQLEAWMGKNDVVVGISTSGNSPNVVEAIAYAKQHGVFCAALVGRNECKLDSVADVAIKVPSAKTPRIQEMHILILHSICEMVETRLSQEGRI